MIIALAAAALLLMRVRRPAVPRAGAPGGGEEGTSDKGTFDKDSEGRHSHPAGGHDDAGPNGSPHTSVPVGVRGLLPRLMHIGSAVRVGKRHDRDDHR